MLRGDSRRDTLYFEGVLRFYGRIYVLSVRDLIRSFFARLIALDAILTQGQLRCIGI